MKLRAKFTYLFIGLIAVSALAVAAAEVSARLSRRRAERLLHDVRQLHVGKSTYEDARAVIVGHGGGVSPYDHSGCSPIHCTYEVALKHDPTLSKVWFGYISEDMAFAVIRVFSPLGLMDSLTGATVRVDDGIVTQVDYGVFVRSRDARVLGREVREFKLIPKYLQDRVGQRSYFVNWFNITTVGGGEGIDSILTTQANTEERSRAYDFDFDCLTMLGGCTSLCQFAPSAFGDLVQQTHRVPYADEKDPSCARFKPPVHE